ncbi:hypothetical protein ACVIEM_007031 [Rhizobium leguminosarum]
MALQHRERRERAVPWPSNGSMPSIVAREAFVAARLEAGMAILAPWNRAPTIRPGQRVSLSFQVEKTTSALIGEGSHNLCRIIG